MRLSTDVSVDRMPANRVGRSISQQGAGCNEGCYVEQVLSLALPFFGLIIIGFVTAKLKRIPAEGLAWLNVFIIYVSLPAMFYQLLSKTPIEQLANGTYIVATTLCTFAAFATSFVIGMLTRRRNIPDATIIGLAGAYSNIGYMGPGLTLATLGPAASVPTALIFCFDNALHFTMAPLMMGLAGASRESKLQMVWGILKRIFTHPFIVATIVAVALAAFQIRPPEAIEKMLQLLGNAAAPCALFTLGVTVALRPVGTLPVELPLVVFLKLIAHPVLVYLVLTTIGGFDRIWVMTAVLMAALPPALNVFVIAQQYNTYVDRASTTVLVGTFVSILTVTGLLYLITHDLIPVALH
jgi:predicted permease